MTSRPALISWNLTRACNLACGHCYLGARQASPDELTTDEGLDILRQIEGAGAEMVILSGGEPLLRPDLQALVAEGARRGLTMVLGTNGCLLDEASASGLASAGLRGAGISLDSVRPQAHDAFRGIPGAWAAALRGLAACQRAGIPVVLQATVLPWNCYEVEDLVALAVEKGAWGINFYFLVCTGRGETMTNITPEQYWQSLRAIHRAQDRYPKTAVRARCAPQLVAEETPGLSGAGCMAGDSYARITPEGDLTPCPYLPLTAGNLRRAGLSEIWRTALLLQELRGATPRQCQPCRFRESCRGCRARGYAASADLAGDDPWCRGPVSQPESEGHSLTWAPDALERLSRVPSFVRPIVKRAVEAHALGQGCVQVTVDVMVEVRARMRPGASRESPSTLLR